MNRLLIVTFFTAMLFSCSQKEVEPVATVTTQKNSHARLDSPDLDWEGLDQYPLPGGGLVGNPWGTLTSSQYSDQIRFDYHKRDGWVLMYNTFNANVPSSYPAMFVLYNRFRGVMRMYNYVKPSANFINSDNLVHSFRLVGSAGNQSNLLSYSGKEIVNLTDKPLVVSQVENFQVGPSTWYACEFELAYDPNISNYNYQSLLLQWNFQGEAISQVKLNGSIELKGTGTFTAPKLDLAISGLSFPVENIAGTNITTHGADQTKSFLQTIGSALADGFSEGLTGLASKAVSSFFNMLTGNQEDKSSINLDLNGTVKLDGNIDNRFLVGNYSFGFPGYDQNSISGYSPYTNEKLGVFTLTGVPTITRQLNTNTGNNTHYATYTINANSFDVIFNPDMLQYADVTNVEKLIVWDHKRETYGGVFYQSGSRGYAAGSDTYTGDSFLSLGYNFNGEDLENTSNASDNFAVYVKVAFTIVPKDGGPAVYIVKTFYPNYIIN